MRCFWSVPSADKAAKVLHLSVRDNVANVFMQMSQGNIRGIFDLRDSLTFPLLCNAESAVSLTFTLRRGCLSLLQDSV